MHCWVLGAKGNSHCLGDSCARQTPGRGSRGRILGPFQAPALTQSSPEPLKALAQRVDVTSTLPEDL